MDKPQVGDKVSVRLPCSWRRLGVILETDYSLLGVDDAVKIQFTDESVKSEPAWWSSRWVVKEAGYTGEL